LGALGAGNAGHLVLSLYFKAILGIQRIFHFDTQQDPGFAILTGGTKVLRRRRLGALLRCGSLAGVRGFMRVTAPRLAQAACHWLSIDEHAIARFTRKFRIPKGFHTIRNKKMKIEKLTFVFDVAGRVLHALVASPGDVSLAHLAQQLLAKMRRRTRGATLRVILDAGAAHSYNELLDLVSRPQQVTLVRVPRRPAYRAAWNALPAEVWTPLEEPGPYLDAPPKPIAIAETRTTIHSKSRTTPVSARTIVIRETSTRGKHRWHALWIFGDEDTPAYELVHEFRTRQHHEQTYRIMLHDIHVDTAPSGYNKRSLHPERPGFQQNALTLYGWIAALATNALQAFSLLLPTQFHRAHPRTLRRYFLFTPAELFLGHDTLIVLLKPKRLLVLWRFLVQRANQRYTRIPWLDNRRLILSLDAPPAAHRPEVSSDPLG
jgi:hypothetical protein